jgi:hypothetical protein
MTTAQPKLEKLKPNSNWAKLPLFNRKHWSRLRFAVPPLTGAGEPKTWLVRLLRRDCWPEFGENLFDRSRLRVAETQPGSDPAG